MQKVVAVLLCTLLSVVAAAQTDAPAYVLQLKPEAQVLDARAAAEQVARTYGGELIAGDGALAGQYVVKVSASRARMMIADHRVARLTPVADALSAAEWSSGVSYTYDGSGNITAAGADQFVYDTLNRIKVSTVAGEKRTYTYDAYGNRTACQKADGTACEQAAPVDTSTNRINAAGVQYDGAGNLTSANGRTYTYDALNTLTTETYGNSKREYVYAAGGERIAVHDVAGQWWNWTVRGLDGKVLREFTSRDGSNGALGTNDWKWTKDYIWRDGLLLATVQPNAAGTGTTTYHYHLDHLGTPRMVTDSNGFVVGLHDYHPFGSEAANPVNESPLTAMKFTGHERDTIAGQNDALDYMHARFYNSQWGRFLSVDPVLGTPNRPQSWNRYVYVENNAINRLDPTGKCGESASFIGPVKRCMEVVKQVVDKAAFVVAKPALTVMSGIINDSPREMASGTAQLVVAGAVGGTTSALLRPAATLGQSTSLAAASRLALNLGGEGKVAGAVVNVQAGSMGGSTALAVRSAVDLARQSGQSVVVASGDALPFASGAVNTVITNNVPINAGMTYFGRSFVSSEIYRVLSAAGRWIGSSAP